MEKGKEKEMQEINFSDLEEVTGGNGGTDYLSGPLQKGRGSVRDTETGARPYAPSMSAGSDDLPVEELRAVTASDLGGPGMFCPRCRQIRKHTGFSGGRMKCNVCGLMH